MQLNSIENIKIECEAGPQPEVANSNKSAACQQQNDAAKGGAGTRLQG
jgi:hypothetical protein